MPVAETELCPAVGLEIITGFTLEAHINVPAG